MHALQKITLEIPEELLERAREVTGQGITATVRRGLELVAASRIYDELRKFRGQVQFSLDLDELRQDRT